MRQPETKSLEQIVNESGEDNSELREMMRLDVEHLDRLHERYQAAGDDSELADHLMHQAWEAERDWVNENAELAFTVTWQQHQISRQVNSDCHFAKIWLYKYSNRRLIRQATITEVEDSIASYDSHEGDSLGVIMADVDGKPTACYVR